MSTFRGYLETAGDEVANDEVFDDEVVSESESRRESVPRVIRRIGDRSRGRLSGDFGHRALLLLMFLLSATVSPVATDAEDVVTLSTTSDRNIRFVGEIVDLTGATLVFRRNGRREESIDGRRVIQVESSWTEQQREADSLFQQREYQRARVVYRQAMGREARTWVKRRMAARLVWCNRYLDQVDKAGQMFRTLYRSDPTTRDFMSIPMVWTSKQLESPTEALMHEWLADKASPVARLMGASWLLSTSSRAAAIQTLKQLVGYDDLRVAFLAEAQLWRTQSATAGEQEIDRWSARIEKMPSAIRAGPYFVLASALARQGAFESSALAYLRIPILHAEQRRLAAQALLTAARQLKKMDQVTEAQGLYREVMLEYADEAAADEARRKFEAVKP